MKKILSFLIALWVVGSVCAQPHQQNWEERMFSVYLGQAPNRAMPFDRVRLEKLRAIPLENRNWFIQQANIFFPAEHRGPRDRRGEDFSSNCFLALSEFALTAESQNWFQSMANQLQLNQMRPRRNAWNLIDRFSSIPAEAQDREWSLGMVRICLPCIPNDFDNKVRFVEKLKWIGGPLYLMHNQQLYEDFNAIFNERFPALLQRHHNRVSVDDLSALCEEILREVVRNQNR